MTGDVKRGFACIVLISLGMVLAGSVSYARTTHCYLCQGIPLEAPCLIDAATGDIAELRVSRDNRSMSWKRMGSILLQQKQNSVHALIYGTVKGLNPGLFCKSCAASIKAVSHNGYVLADLQNLDAIQLYPVEDGTDMMIQSYHITVSIRDDHKTVVTAATAS